MRRRIVLSRNQEVNSPEIFVITDTKKLLYITDIIKEVMDY